MAYQRHEGTVPGYLLTDVDSSDHQPLVDITFDWAPGTEPSGLSGPPENYDPGEGDEFVIVTPEGLGEEIEEAIINWLDENWERPVEPDDPDWLRDEKVDWEG